MMPKISPAYPAAWLLYAMIFAFAAAHFIGVPWPRGGAVAVYSAAAVWVAVLAWRKRWDLWPPTVLDALFVGFVLLVSASLVFQWTPSGEPSKYARFLPFMVVIPYLCGRLMGLADVRLIWRVILLTGLLLLPLLLLDRLISPGRESGRWAFFGLDHGALVAGALVATLLVALCVRALDRPNPGERQNRPDRFILYALIGLTTVFLVWVTARGWLLAGLGGGAVTCLFARHRTIAIRGGLLTAVLVVAGGSIVMLPKLDANFGGLYAMTLDKDSRAAFGATGPILGATGPILGEASCQPFKEGINSVAMRGVMYREAVAMFLENPVLGVGADRFGERSCTGPGWYPHNTLLQAYAELGLVGGGLLTVLMALAAVTLVRPLLAFSNGTTKWVAHVFALALFTLFFLVDQFYGNYFQAIGVWLTLGIASSLRAGDKRGSEKSG
jgi:hypothetical protein